MTTTLLQLKLDVTLQARNGFYYAILAAIIVPVAALSWLETSMLTWMLPAILFGTYLLNGMLFMAGLILLERAEGTLQALAISPLRTGQYLASKLLSLVLLSMAESLTVAFLLNVPMTNLLLVILGIASATILLAVLGLLLAVKYRSINELLMPSVAWGILSQLPLLPYFDIGDQWFVWLHPLHPALILIESGFSMVPAWEVTLATALTLIWVIGSVYLAQRVMRNFMKGDCQS